MSALIRSISRLRISSSSAAGFRNSERKSMDTLTTSLSMAAEHEMEKAVNKGISMTSTFPHTLLGRCCDPDGEVVSTRQIARYLLPLTAFASDLDEGNGRWNLSQINCN